MPTSEERASKKPKTIGKTNLARANCTGTSVRVARLVFCYHLVLLLYDVDHILKVRDVLQKKLAYRACSCYGIQSIHAAASCWCAALSKEINVSKNQVPAWFTETDG